MDRNVESHFAFAPSTLDVSRSQFGRNSSVKLTMNTGDVVPFYVDEIYPGDTVNLTTSKVIRLQTMLDPIYDNIYLDTYYFFVPNRLLWKDWKYFMGESETKWYNSENVHTSIPKYVVPANGVKSGSLADYLGIPLNAPPGSKLNVFPFRAYAKICEDWFRATPFTDPLVIPNDGADMCADDLTFEQRADDLYCAYGEVLFKAAKYHDYFTSCLPSPQCGPTITLPLGQTAPVVDATKQFDDSASFFAAYPDAKPLNFYSRDALTNTPYSVGSGLLNLGSLAYPTSPASESYKPLYIADGDDLSHAARKLYSAPFEAYADLSQATATTVNDLRLAFQIQKYYEKQAYGNRYIESIKSQFGVSSPDARLQRSEYLGGNRVPLNIHEVVNTSEGENSFLGNLGATSSTADVSSDVLFSASEHGFVIGVCVARYDHTYGQGVERFWLQDDLFSYYFPVFSNIGDQPVFRDEIYFTDERDSNGNRIVFGYNEPWAYLRYKNNRLAGEMRNEHPQSLSSWHLGDDYEVAPTLSDSWIREDKTNVDRTLAVTSAVSNQIFADIFVQNNITRILPMYSIPGLIDHH